MPKIDDLKIVLSPSKPNTHDVHTNTLYIFIKELKERSFRFLIDNDVIPKKAGVGEAAAYPRFGDKEKGFILHNNELYFIDNAATESADNKLMLPYQFEPLKHFKDLISESRDQLTFDEVREICQITAFKSNSIQSEFSTKNDIRILYRFHEEDKPMEIGIDWAEIKTGEQQILTKALRSLKTSTPLSISSELDKNIKEAFLIHTVPKTPMMENEQPEFDLLFMNGKYYQEKITFRMELEKEIDTLKELQSSFQTPDSPNESKNSNKKLKKYLTEFDKSIKKLETSLKTLDKKIEDLKESLRGTKPTPIKKSRSAFFTSKSKTPKTFQDIMTDISYIEFDIKELKEKTIEAIKIKIENVKNQKPGTLDESIDNSLSSSSQSQTLEVPKSGLPKSRSFR